MEDDDLKCTNICNEVCADILYKVDNDEQSESDVVFKIYQDNDNRSRKHL